MHQSVKYGLGMVWHRLTQLAKPAAEFYSFKTPNCRALSDQICIYPIGNIPCVDFCIFECDSHFSFNSRTYEHAFGVFLDEIRVRFDCCGKLIAGLCGRESPVPCVLYLFGQSQAGLGIECGRRSQDSAF